MSREVFKQSIGYLLEVVSEIKPEQWDQNTIGNWTVRHLVGHSSRLLGRLEEHAAASPVEPTGVDVTTSSDARGFASFSLLPCRLRYRAQPGGEAGSGIDGS